MGANCVKILENWLSDKSEVNNKFNNLDCLYISCNTLFYKFLFSSSFCINIHSNKN